jgi:hypothetical protein
MQDAGFRMPGSGCRIKATGYMIHGTYALGCKPYFATNILDLALHHASCILNPVSWILNPVSWILNLASMRKNV